MKLGPPKSTPEYMAPMWASFLYWTIKQPDAIAAFEADTGVKVGAAKTPLDRMIDDATGASEGIVKAFVDWFNENVWGEID